MLLKRKMEKFTFPLSIPNDMERIQIGE